MILYCVEETMSMGENPDYAIKFIVANFEVEDHKVLSQFGNPNIKVICNA